MEYFGTAFAPANVESIRLQAAQFIRKHPKVVLVTVDFSNTVWRNNRSD
jgi:hypothetical protein